jgi:effector-binding domain-containing protein
MTAAILTKIVPDITFAGAREVVADHEMMRERCIALDTQACQTISRLNLRVDGPSCALYYPHDTGIDVEMGYPVRTIDSDQIDTSAAGPNLHTLPAAEIAYAVYTGSYDDFAAVGQLHVALSEWVADHGATPTGPVRELYLQPSTNPRQGVMELQYPLG